MEKLLQWYVGRPRMLEGSALTIVLILGLIAAGLTGCAPTISMKDMQTALAQAASFKAEVPREADTKCEGAALPGDGLSEARVFGTLQTANLDICDKRRALGVEVIKDHNARVDKVVNELRPLTFWERIFGRRKVK